MSKNINDYEELWFDMPEFKQEKQRPFSEIKIRFASEEDLIEFSKIIGQKLTPKTKSIWHPKLERGKYSSLRWCDEK